MSVHQYFQRVVCINLPKRTDRLARVTRSFNAHGINATIVPGVLPNLNLIPQNYAPPIGAWGCSRSHQGIYQKALHDGVDSVLVFEDDLVFEQSFNADLDAAMKELPKDWQLLYLGCAHAADEQPTPISPLIAKATHAYLTHAYAIKTEAMRAVLRHPKLNFEPIDVVLPLVQKQVPTYWCRKNLVSQEPFYDQTDIQNTPRMKDLKK